MVLKTLRKVLRNYYKYMFKDTKEGSTHHDKDACYKCKVCGAHFFRDIILQHACVTKETLREWDNKIDSHYDEFGKARDNIDLTNK